MPSTRDLQRAFAFPWHEGNRPLFLLAVTAIIILASIPLVLLAVFAGDEGIPTSIAYLFAILLVASVSIAGMMYRAVGRRANRARAALDLAEPDIESPCLMVNGLLQSPGSALIKDGRLYLVPAVGKLVEVDLASVEVEEIPKRFNGSTYPGQSGFWIRVAPITSRLGFMPDDPDAWRSQLNIQS